MKRFIYPYKQFNFWTIMLLLIILLHSSVIIAQNTNNKAHPNLILTPESVTEIRSKLGSVPLFDRTLEKTKMTVDAAMQKRIDVPVPRDLAGGYTHTQHKFNYIVAQQAGVLFQLTKEEKYAQYVRDILMEYARLYPTLPLHPQKRSYARGKIFWQCLNDANWLVYMSQAYDCIYDWLQPEEQNTLNNDLFIPFANFLSVGSPQFFNRIHNHSTWGNVAVGMIGLVLDNEELIQKALYGIKDDKISANAKDNDGGLIKTAGQATGFLANLDHPFSPDGYYTEGPYYQRYAMYPFMIFAQALQNKKPVLNIFKYRNGVLLKAVDALLNLTDYNGEFFPLNDGQKGMSYHNSSLVSAVDIAFYFGNQDPRLLAIAKAQEEVQLDATGLLVATAIQNGADIPYNKTSMLLRDGSNGDSGSIALLRNTSENNTMTLVMKNTSHGLSHGHFDKLSFSLYENGQEVLQDYGLARFVNIEQKNGGGYLKENTSWAKQTVAHNTVVQDRTTEFNGNIEESSKYFPEVLFFDIDTPNLQIVSAEDKNSYQGTTITRTMVMIKEEKIQKPYILDLMVIDSDTLHDYDLPYHYFGQIIHTSFPVNSSNTLKPLGSSNGYQHLWKEAEATLSGGSQFTWLSEKKFYTITSATDPRDKAIFARIGANDPKFNLRRDPVYILYKNQVKETVFANIIESHGTYDPVSERAKQAYSIFKEINILKNSETYLVIEIIKQSGEIQMLCIVKDIAKLQKKQTHVKAEHNVQIKGQSYHWKGTHSLQLIKK
ncbi:alginate lyase family protein [Aquimarina sp. W85]|uniref:alginate lyase family protein n=1 Tax=Aquimarina rhodophyticola TaxID=3342246 RepID=UPI003672660E